MTWPSRTEAIILTLIYLSSCCYKTCVKLLAESELLWTVWLTQQLLWFRAKEGTDTRRFDRWKHIYRPTECVLPKSQVSLSLFVTEPTLRLSESLVIQTWEINRADYMAWEWCLLAYCHAPRLWKGTEIVPNRSPMGVTVYVLDTIELHIC